MKYTINVNQFAAINSGLNLDLIDLAIFDFIKSYTLSCNCVKMAFDGATYFAVTHKKIIDELPVLGIKTTRGILVHINKLIKAGVLVRMPKTQSPNVTMYRFGENYENLEFCNNPQTKIEEHKEPEQEHGTKQVEELASYEVVEDEAPRMREKSEPKKTLFRNSEVFNLVKFNGYDADYSELQKRFSAPEFNEIDLAYYFNAVADWSDQSDTKRTANGWIATIRTFIRRDIERGNVKKTIQSQQRKWEAGEKLMELIEKGIIK